MTSPLKEDIQRITTKPRSLTITSTPMDITKVKFYYKQGSERSPQESRTEILKFLIRANLGS